MPGKNVVEVHEHMFPCAYSNSTLTGKNTYCISMTSHILHYSMFLSIISESHPSQFWWYPFLNIKV